MATYNMTELIKQFCTEMHAHDISELPDGGAFIIGRCIDDVILPDGLKEITYYIADQRLRDMPTLAILDKAQLLLTMRQIIQIKKIKKIDRTVFHKEIKGPLLDLEKETYLDLTEVDLFLKSHKDKHKLSLLRKFGPPATGYKNPLRVDFANMFTAKKYLMAKNSILQLRFRVILNNKDVVKAQAALIEEHFLARARLDNLDIGALEKLLAEEKKLKASEVK